MKKYMKKEKIVEELSEFKCDICELDFLNNDNELDEMVSISNIGGYYSIFGDGNYITLDMCQHCFKKYLGEYIKINSSDIE